MGARGWFFAPAESSCAFQPAADCLCFCGFLAIGDFRGARGSEKRGGAGSMSGMGDCGSGNRAADGLTNVRSSSGGDMGEGCRDLW